MGTISDEEAIELAEDEAHRNCSFMANPSDVEEIEE